MKTNLPSVSNLYLLASALLITHEIDSGYWQEWKLFGIPGGNQVFVFLNLILVTVVLYGFTQVLVDSTRASFFSLLLAAGGVLAFGIHIVFIALGNGEFTEPVSLVVLGSLLIVSLMLANVELQRKKAAK